MQHTRNLLQDDGQFVLILLLHSSDFLFIHFYFLFMHFQLRECQARLLAQVILSYSHGTERSFYLYDFVLIDLVV